MHSNFYFLFIFFLYLYLNPRPQTKGVKNLCLNYKIRTTKKNHLKFKTEEIMVYNIN